MKLAIVTLVVLAQYGLASPLTQEGPGSLRERRDLMEFPGKVVDAGAQVSTKAMGTMEHGMSTIGTMFTTMFDTAGGVANKAMESAAGAMSG